VCVCVPGQGEGWPIKKVFEDDTTKIALRAAAGRAHSEHTPPPSSSPCADYVIVPPFLPFPSLFIPLPFPFSLPATAPTGPASSVACLRETIYSLPPPPSDQPWGCPRGRRERGRRAPKMFVSFAARVQCDIIIK